MVALLLWLGMYSYMRNAPVKLFWPYPPPRGQPQGQKKNVCDKKGGVLENDVKKGGALENEGIKVIRREWIENK